MNVRFTGRHVGISDEDRAWVEGKAAALSRFHRRLDEFEVRVGKDGGLFVEVEIEVNLGHQHRALGRAEAPEFRAAFEHAAEALRKQLLRDKERVVDRRRRSASRDRSPGRREP